MRLTQGMKDAIKSSVIKKKFNPLYAALKEKEISFGLEVYKTIPHIEKVDNVPGEWLDSKTELSVTFDGWSKRVYFGKALKVPYHTRLYFSQESEEYKKHHALAHERGVLDEFKNEVESEINKVLSACTTDKKLSELWPEAMEHLPNAAQSLLPAIINIDKLKSLLA